jgi:hypothetical protein
MHIQANISIEVDCHTVLAEIAIGAKRPELKKICQTFRASGDYSSVDALRAALPAQEIVLNAGKPYEERFKVQLNDRGLYNLLQLLSDLELVKDGKLTPRGIELCDDPDAKVPVAEQGAYRLATFHHEACGLQVQSLRRITTQEIRGPEFQSLQDQATYELDPLHTLSKGKWYETVEKPQRFKFLSYAGPEPRCIQHPTVAKCLRVNLSSETSPSWQLLANLNAAEGPVPRPAPNLEAKLAAIIDSILRQAPTGEWDGQHLAVEFNATNEAQRATFEADFTVTDLEAAYLGHITEAACAKIPLRPASQDTAAHWVKECALNLKLNSPTTRSQFIKIIEGALGAYEARFKGLTAMVPTNDALAQAHLASNNPSKIADYWHLQAPLDLAPLDVAELDTSIDLFAAAHRVEGRLARSAGLTIEHHQLIEYPELLGELWTESAAPTDILLCDRHMLAPPQSKHLLSFVEAIRLKWPDTQIELWHLNDRNLNNSTQLVEACKQHGCAIKPIPASILNGKIHDRFLLLKHPAHPTAAWDASNSLLNPHKINGHLRWPQLCLTRIKAEHAHPEIRNWAK